MTHKENVLPTKALAFSTAFTCSLFLSFCLMSGHLRQHKLSDTIEDITGRVRMVYRSVAVQKTRSKLIFFLQLHVLLQMLSTETFTNFRVRASASSLLGSALASARGDFTAGRSHYFKRSLPCLNQQFPNRRR
jgi:hypothetical protein